MTVDVDESVKKDLEGFQELLLKTFQVAKTLRDQSI
jgi:hypothetical protein